MHIVIVSIHVKTEYIEEFKQASLENAANSILEPGITRFDVLQEKEDSTRFILYEVYQTADDQLRHRETAHYLAWREKVEKMMAEPRKGVAHVNLFPADKDWIKR